MAAEIARRAGARVYSQAFLGDGPQRNHGLQYCTCEWVLNLDADERLEDNALEAIRALDLTETRFEAFELRRKNLLQGRRIRRAGWHPDYVRRLFDRRRTRFSPVQVHIEIESNEHAHLDADIVHTSFRDYADMVARVNAYSSWISKSRYESDGKITALSPPLHGLFAFLKHYLLRGGVLAGVDGLTISLTIAFGSYPKYAKLLEFVRYPAETPESRPYEKER